MLGHCQASVLPSDNTQLSQRYEHALKLICRALDLYGPEELAFSFNGGKDSTTVLHLLRSGLKLWQERRGQAWEPSQGLLGVHTFFFIHPDDFDEVIEFVRECDRQYHLNVTFYTGDFKDGLEKLLSERPIRAIFLGTRHGDPNCQDQEFFCPSSEGWPAFMRVNPVLNWAYDDVWTYLQAIGAMHCRLYDQGYTSLGSIKNTMPNRALQRSDDGRLERAGRVTRGDSAPQLHATLAHTAALLVIGDELLAGKVRDENISFLASHLHSLGWRVVRCVMLPDDEDVITSELQQLKRHVEVVITCGGIGPTVDDCTLAAVATAAGVHLARNMELETMLRRYFGEQVTEAHLTMAQTPEGSTELLHYTETNGKPSPFPVLKVGNVLVLPGVPALLKSKWGRVEQFLEASYGASHGKYHSRVLRLQLRDEAKIAGTFQRVSQEFASVAIGSYPGEPHCSKPVLYISMESKDEALLQVAVDRFCKLLDEDPDQGVHIANCLLGIDVDVAEFPRRSADRQRCS